MRLFFKSVFDALLRGVLCLAWLAAAHGAADAQSPGSLFVSGGALTGLARDVRASAPGDIVTILVLDRADAQATGATDTSRKSAGSAQVTSLLGTLAAGNPLGNLLEFSNDRTLQGTGRTARGATLSTTVTARVVGITPAGLLQVEGSKETTVNSERQIITVRGLIRPVDVTPANTIQSNQIADLSLQVNGKGVVDDAIRRPNILYRLLLGLLPF